MPSYCASLGCNNSTGNIGKKGKHVSFHRFPLKNEKLLKMWLVKMRRHDFVPGVTSKICSEHFEANCFDYQNFTNRRTLKNDAIPTIFSFPTDQPTFPTNKRRRYAELLFGYHNKPEYDTDDPDGAVGNSDAVLTGKPSGKIASLLSEKPSVKITSLLSGKPSQDSSHPDYIQNTIVAKPATNEKERSREEIHEKDVNNTDNKLVEMDSSWEPICEINEGKPSQDSNHSNYVSNIHEKNVSVTANNLVEMDLNSQQICQIDEGKPSQVSSHSNYVPSIHEKNVSDIANNLVEMDVNWEPVCQIDEGKPSQDSNHPDYVPNILVSKPATHEKERSGKEIHEKNVSDAPLNLVEMDVNWEPIGQIDKGEAKTKTGLHTPSLRNQRMSSNRVKSLPLLLDEKERSRDEIHEKNISNTANNLVEVDVNLETTCHIQKEIPAVENIIVKEEIEIEDGANTSASGKIKEISAFKIVRVKQEAEHENNEIITVAEQLKGSPLNDELQQTKIELQQAYAKINTLVAEKNKLNAAILTEKAFFTANSKQKDELKLAKLDLQMAYVDKDNLIAKKNELMRELEDSKGTNNSLLAAISEKECEFSKVKKELEQAYSEINALRKEKEELMKKVPASDLPQSILHCEKKLYFYTGLNTAKDFQAVLSLLSPDQSDTKILPFDSQVLIVLIKIKWNFRNADLAYRFNISMNSVQRMCSTLIPILKTKLELIVNGPINKALKRNIPQSFKNSVYEKLLQRLQMQKFLKPRNKEDESSEPDLEQI